ncbi:hypothetical protein J3Q64DRAFT_1842429 [Phycomyces blakesleeanus]|uniref:Uncharacterized protein n=2 Tax=Phycomyces blakesleeanus TaxID=4837 RepID=A0A162UZR1_PHYB8|nr:hypothetical protein PHYBLDRAFT_164126 [Phycomyces blakesleeanus NRRL 1555(-)]OAD79043.1 hypothetical protein PHYBLDRAFT_164126 [Phycomyces blakesleeanus NRRL 1555(-)]|eukprot:XP_018297083.1 hypothetical protein PHYBLDRAFT_164126 [Phycomyces blakesleeanus NRRL 1555(-)]
MSTVNIIPMNENIYTRATISEVLECSSIPRVMTLRLNSTIRTIRNSNKRHTDITAEEAKNSGIKMCFSQEYSCHHSRTYESKAEIGFFKTPEWYEIILTKDHADHTPGNICEDNCTLPLAKKYLHEPSQQLEQSSKSASQIRIDMLRAIDTY